MEFGVGSILDGKVTGITKFGAFVALPEGRSGLVHISEIAYTYVNEVSDYLKEGQEVKVKVIGIDQANRINLSIKKVSDPPPRPAGGQGGRPARTGGAPRSGRAQPAGAPAGTPDRMGTRRGRWSSCGRFSVYGWFQSAGASLPIGKGTPQGRPPCVLVELPRENTIKFQTRQREACRMSAAFRERNTLC